MNTRLLLMMLGACVPPEPTIQFAPPPGYDAIIPAPAFEPATAEGHLVYRGAMGDELFTRDADGWSATRWQSGVLVRRLITRFGTTAVGLYDIDDNGTPDLVLRRGGTIRAYDVLSSDRTLDLSIADGADGRIADLDADGTPEWMQIENNTLRIRDLTGQILASSPTSWFDVAQLDADAPLEVLVDGAVLQGSDLTADGQPVPPFPVHDVADLNGDGRDELLLRTGTRWMLWQGDQVRWTHDTSLSSQHPATARFVDWDRDGVWEAILPAHLASTSGYIVVDALTARPITALRPTSRLSRCQHLVAIDVDGDGSDEIGCDGLTQVLDLARGRFVHTGPPSIDNPIVADLDGDGLDELVSLGGQANGDASQSTAVWNPRTLDVLSEQLLFTDLDPLRVATIGDVEGDGAYELVRTDASIRFFDWRPQSGFSVATTLPSSRTITNPALMDLDGDGGAEIVYVSNQLSLRALDLRTGSSSPLNVLVGSDTHAVGVDLDQDGVIEVLLPDSPNFSVLSPEGDFLDSVPSERSILLPAPTRTLVALQSYSPELYSIYSFSQDELMFIDTVTLPDEMLPFHHEAGRFWFQRAEGVVAWQPGGRIWLFEGATLSRPVVAGDHVFFLGDNQSVWPLP